MIGWFGAFFIYVKLIIMDAKQKAKEIYESVERPLIFLSGSRMDFIESVFDAYDAVKVVDSKESEQYFEDVELELVGLLLDTK